MATLLGGDRWTEDDELYDQNTFFHVDEDEYQEEEQNTFFHSDD